MCGRDTYCTALSECERTPRAYSLTRICMQTRPIRSPEKATAAELTERLMQLRAVFCLPIVFAVQKGRTPLLANQIWLQCCHPCWPDWSCSAFNSSSSTNSSLREICTITSIWSDDKAVSEASHPNHWIFVARRKTKRIPVESDSCTFDIRKRWYERWYKTDWCLCDFVIAIPEIKNFKTFHIVRESTHSTFDTQSANLSLYISSTLFNVNHSKRISVTARRIRSTK